MSKYTPGPGDTVTVQPWDGVEAFVGGTVVRVNQKSIRVALHRDVYRNGTREERFPHDRVWLASDRVYAPHKVARRPWR